MLIVIALLIVIGLLVSQAVALIVFSRRRQQLVRTLENQAAELRRHRFADRVTGLGNRDLLRERAANTDPVGRPVSAVVLIDLDRFKDVNDALGHEAGDALLVQVSRRLVDLVRSSDTVARLGGDEFAILLTGTSRSAAIATAKRIVANFRHPLDLDGGLVTLRASAGVAFMGGGLDFDEALRLADLTMYEAKSAGGDRALVFDPRIHHDFNERLQLEAQLRSALENHEIVVHFQPIVATASGRPVSLEALVRWHHPCRGVLAPEAWLGAANQAGLMVQIGAIVLRQACQRLAEFRRSTPDLTVAVNLSERELQDPGLVDRVAAVLTDTGLPAEALHLEITETVAGSSEAIVPVLSRLVDLGVQLSLDDFGTGHSSLSRLRDLPVTRIKIDRSFTGEISQGEAPLLSSILSLANTLGHTVVAEGVETEDQWDFLVAHGCTEIQGYLFSRAVPADDVPGVLVRRLRGRATETAGPAGLQDVVGDLVRRDQPLEEPLRHLLAELATLAGLDTVFLTRVIDGHQITEYAHNGGRLNIGEGLCVPWSDTLCRRMIADGRVQRSDVLLTYPDHAAARELNIQTFVSVPVRGGEGELVGTLCGASPDSTEVDSGVLALLHLVARVLADRLAVPQL